MLEKLRFGKFYNVSNDKNENFQNVVIICEMLVILSKMQKKSVWAMMKYVDCEASGQEYVSKQKWMAFQFEFCSRETMKSYRF